MKKTTKDIYENIWSQTASEEMYLSSLNFIDSIYIPALRNGVTELLLTEEEFMYAVTSAASMNQFEYVTEDTNKPYCKGFGIRLTA